MRRFTVLSLGERWDGLLQRLCTFPYSGVALYDNENSGTLVITETLGGLPSDGSMNYGIGIGGFGKAGLDLNRSLALRARPLTTLAAGTNNNVDDASASGFQYATVYEITQPGAAFTITGLRAGVEGQVVTLVNLTGQAMTLAHQSSSSSTNNRILSSTGADVTLTPAGTGFSSATLRYSTSQHRWLYSA